MSRLAAQIPLTIARRMALTGETLNAEQAAACHLINEVVPEPELLERAMSEARKIAAHPLPALQAEMSPAGRFGMRESPWDALALLNELWPLQRR